QTQDHKVPATAAPAERGKAISTEKDRSMTTKGHTKVWSSPRKSIIGHLVKSLPYVIHPQDKSVPFGIDFYVRQRISFRIDSYVRQRVCDWPSEFASNGKLFLSRFFSASNGDSGESGRLFRFIAVTPSCDTLAGTTRCPCFSPFNAPLFCLFHRQARTSEILAV
ncbi:MAG: hypothetical protein M0Z71_16190, partial [Nitrospiraceae bacterium]|nr:hypothetical protein [Nitrospiraceae bacterium]